MRISDVLRPLPFLLIVLLTCTLAPAGQRPYAVHKEDSQVEFSIYKWLVFREEGRFRDFSGSVIYDPKNPESLSVELTVQTASVDSRAEGRDRALRSEDYFHSAKYAVMTFRSTSVKALANNEFSVTGDFTIRDVTRRITVPVKLLGLNTIGGEMGELIAFETSFTINRLEYGVGTPSNWLANDVAIHLLIGASSNGRTASR